MVDFTSKKIKSGGYQKFLVIQWDHLQTPCEHARGRICHLDEFPKLMRRNNCCLLITMTEPQHPITPPPKLVEKWIKSARYREFMPYPEGSMKQYEQRLTHHCRPLGR